MAYLDETGDPVLDALYKELDAIKGYTKAESLRRIELKDQIRAIREQQDAMRDLGVGSLRFGAYMTMAPEIDWLMNRFSSSIIYPNLMASPGWRHLQETRPKETKDFSNLVLAAQGGRGDEQHQEWAKGQLNKYHGMKFGEWMEQVPEFIDELVPFKKTLGSKAVEDAELLLVAGWGIHGIAKLFSWAATKGIPKGRVWLRDKIRSIVKNKQSEEILDDIVPKDIVPEASLQIEHKPLFDARIDKTVERATAGEKAKDVSEVDTDQLLKRMEKRNKKMAVEADKEVAKIKKEYADTGIEEFTENDKMFVTKPDGMTNEEALKKASEMYKRQIAAREKVGKKWDNLDIAKDEAAEYERALKYWKDKAEKQSAAFQSSDKVDRLLFDTYPEILTQQKREELAVRFINNPEFRAVEKELKKAQEKVGDRYVAGEIGEAEMHKQTFLLREKTDKKLEKLLLDQIKSEVEFEVSSDPFKKFEDIVLKKGDYKDITKHARGGLVENKVNYALNQWK